MRRYCVCESSVCEEEGREVVWETWAWPVAVGEALWGGVARGVCVCGRDRVGVPWWIYNSIFVRVAGARAYISLYTGAQSRCL